MDDNTYEFVKFSNETTDLGIVKAKGRVNGVHAYGIALTLDKTEEAAEINFGNERERAIISQRFMEWQECGRRVVVLVEAPSGLGKSSLANFLMDKARKACIPTCLTQGLKLFVVVC
ncbi:hypothetical protein HK101_010322 [Irineochytrium annulatum]|nr:hypothetical protein HK101_010322 [Irineochytrium annulatum]